MVHDSLELYSLYFNHQYSIESRALYFIINSILVFITNM